MQAGKLRHRITIERRGVTYDDLGHETQAWKAIAHIRALVEELSGRELERARQLVPEATVRITTRRSPTISSDRILFRDRILQVASVVTNPIGTEQTILCTELK